MGKYFFVEFQLKEYTNPIQGFVCLTKILGKKWLQSTNVSFPTVLKGFFNFQSLTFHILIGFEKEMPRDTNQNAKCSRLFKLYIKIGLSVAADLSRLVSPLWIIGCPVLNDNFHWQLMALLLLRHALPMTDTDGDDEDPTAFFSVSWLAVHSIFIFLFKKIS